MTTGNRIRQIRKESGLTLKQFGERIGLGGSTVSMMENGKSKTREQTIQSVCREFHVREAWLRSGEEPMRAPQSEADELDACLDKWGLPREFRGLFSAYRNLRSDADRDAVRQFIREAAEEIAANEAGDTSAGSLSAEYNSTGAEYSEEEQMRREARAEAEEYYLLRLEEKRAINAPEAKRAGTPRNYNSYDSAGSIA